MSGSRTAGGWPPPGPRRKPHGWQRGGGTASSRATSGRQWRLLRDRIMRQAGRTCEVVGCELPAHAVDHIVPVSLGGAELDPDNLQALCKPHHDTKTQGEASAAAAAKRAAPKPQRRSKIHPADLLRDPEPPRVTGWGAPPTGGADPVADIVRADPTTNGPEPRDGTETGRSGPESAQEGAPE